MAKADEKTSVTADASEEGKGSKAVTIIIVLVIVIIWLAIFGVLIKLDVGGFGSGVMYPILKDVPVLSMVLPESKEAENNVKIYDDLDEANEKIKELEEKIAAKSSSDGKNTSEIDKLRAENARLKKYEADQAQFATRVYDFDKQVVFGDKAPDTVEYYNYYSELNKDKAEELTNKVAKKFNYSQKIKDQAETFTKMQPAQAAAALTEMSGDLTLVAKILDCMQASKAAVILDQIEPTVMAQIVTKMTNMKK